MVADGYTEYDSIKIKLRVTDDSMRDEIQLYMHEIDDLVSNRVKNRIGTFDQNNREITLPLKFDTVPSLLLELKAIANDLVVAKIRLQNSEKPLLWDSAVKVLDNFLERIFGWCRDVPFRIERRLTVTPVIGPVATLVTVGGTGFQPTTDLSFKFDGLDVITTPADIITDSKGVFTGATFTVPTSAVKGESEIKVADNVSGRIEKFEVT